VEGHKYIGRGQDETRSQNTEDRKKSGEGVAWRTAGRCVGKTERRRKKESHR